MVTQVVPLEPGVHDVNEFNCGNEQLNEFLRTTAGQHQRKLISKTYVLVEQEKPTKVMGFYTLALRKLVLKEALPPELSKKLPREVPGFSLARLAIHQDLHKQGHGEYLLIHAVKRAAGVSKEVGGYAIFVDAKSREGASWYEKYGFVPFPDDPLILCLPVKNVQGLF